MFLSLFPGREEENKLCGAGSSTLQVALSASQMNFCDWKQSCVDFLFWNLSTDSFLNRQCPSVQHGQWVESCHVDASDYHVYLGYNVVHLCSSLFPVVVLLAVLLLSFANTVKFLSRRLAPFEGMPSASATKRGLYFLHPSLNTTKPSPFSSLLHVASATPICPGWLGPLWRTMEIKHSQRKSHSAGSLCELVGGRERGVTGQPTIDLSPSAAAFERLGPKSDATIYHKNMNLLL